MSESKEYICLKCNHVFQVNPDYAKCCGSRENIEEFNLEKHGRSLIPSSNSWYSVWNMWNDNSKFRKMSRKDQYNNYGAATTLNLFIEKLLKQNKRLKYYNKIKKERRVIYYPDGIGDERKKELSDAVENAIQGEVE